MTARRSAYTLATAVTLAVTLAGADQAFAAESAPTQRVQGEVVTVADGTATESRVLVEGGSFVAVADNAVAEVAPGSTVAVNVPTRTVERRTAAGTGATVIAAPKAASAVPAVHHLTVAIMTPKGVTGAVATPDQVRAQVAGASQYWSEQTGGQVSFDVASISAPLTLTTGCSDFWGMWQEAAKATNFPGGVDNHLVMVLPTAAAGAGCGYGLGSVGSGPNAGGYAHVADTAWPVLAHELGHNLGLAHAERLTCAGGSDADLAALSTKGCSVEDYGDPWDVMAKSARNNAGSLSSPQGYRLGLMPASAFAEVTSGTKSVTLNTISSLSGTRSVRVVDPKTGVAYFVEYRARSGRDYLLYANMAGGVRILREDTRANGAAKPSLALDASPTGSAADLAWGIGTGASWSSYGGGVTVKVTAQDATTASVTVTAGAAPASAPAPATLKDLNPTTGRASGTWYAVPSNAYAFKTAMVTYTAGASWSTTVSGGTFDLIGTAFAQGADGRILIDGKVAKSFTSYRADSANPYQQVLTSVAVPAGQHTLTVVAAPTASRRTLALDAFRLR